MIINTISGSLKVGKTGIMNRFGYSSLNFPSDDKTSTFTTELTYLGSSADFLQIGLSNVKEAEDYPNFCKLYINGKLEYTAYKLNAHDLVCATYASLEYNPENNSVIPKFFSESTIGNSYKIRLEFFDTL